MLLLRFFKLAFAFGMMVVVCSGQPTKRDDLVKIKRILHEFEKVINIAEKIEPAKGPADLAKRQSTNVYPCLETKEEFSVAALMQKADVSNIGIDSTIFIPPKVTIFKCNSLGFVYNEYDNVPCQCKQRYRQMYFQARRSNDCRKWKLIPLTIEDGCHCERAFNR